MWQYIIRRTIACVIVLLLLTIIVFCMVRLTGVDPLYVYYDPTDVALMSDEEITELRTELGLNGNIVSQYGRWLGDLVRGDWGRSFYYKANVTDLVFERLAVTAHIGIIAIILSVSCGILLGVIAAVRRGKWQDVVSTLTANLSITIPIFWLGIILILIFGVKLHWLPVSGYTSPADDFWKGTKQLIMPVICLIVTGMGATARLTRTTMLEVIRQEYIVTARSKGMKERYIITKHALKNALIPVVTVIGFQVQLVLGGSIFIEQVFAIPGIGRLMVDATLGQDYAVVQGGVLVIGMIIVLTNFLIDLSYGWFDPRVRYN